MKNSKPFLKINSNKSFLCEPAVCTEDFKLASLKRQNILPCFFKNTNTFDVDLPVVLSKGQANVRNITCDSDE